ncbi:AAA family ATPase [Kitasatospora sp. NPDC003701]
MTATSPGPVLPRPDPQPAHREHPAHPATSPVFVGRAPELDLLDRSWQQAAAGTARVIGLHGPAGIGKSALAREFLRRHDPTAFTAFTADGDEDDCAVPWSTLARLARRARRLPGADRSAWTALAPPPGTPATADASPARVGAALAEALRGAGPAVLLLDHAHWIDPASLSALRLAVRDLADRPLLVLLLHQDTGPATDPADLRPVPELPPGWRRLLDSEHGLRHPLRGLEPVDLMRLAALCGRPGLSPEGARRLHRHTAGNPLHARLLLDQLTPEALDFGHGPLPAPRGLALTVAARVAACRPGTRELVVAGALLGNRFRLADARALLAGPAGGAAPTVAGAATVAEAVAEAVAGGLLTAVPGSDGGELAFTSPLVRAAVHHDVAGSRTELHRRAALLGAEPVLRHRIGAASGADPGLAPAALAGAADLTARDALPDAARLLRRTLDHTPPGPDRTALLLTTVELLLLTGDAARARAWSGEAARGPAGPQRAYVTGFALQADGRPQAALAHLEAAWAGLDRDGRSAPPGLRARLAARLALVCTDELLPDRAVAYGEAATAALTTEPAGPPTSAASTAPGGRNNPDDPGPDGTWTAGLARYARAVALATAGRPREAPAPAAPPGQVSATAASAASGAVRLLTDDPQGARRDLARALAGAAAGDPLPVPGLPGLLAEAEYRCGGYDDALLHLRNALAEALGGGRSAEPAALHALAARVHAVRGHWPQAEDALLEAARRSRSAPRSGVLAVTAARALLARLREDPDELLAVADALPPAGHSAPAPGTSAAWHADPGLLRAEAFAALGDPDRADHALADFLARHGPPPDRAGAALAARIRARIALTRGRHPQALAECATAAAHAHASRQPLESLHAELSAADCLAAAGRRAGAEARLRRVLAEAGRIGAGALAALAAARLARLGLDPRAPSPDLAAAEHAAGLTAAERMVLGLLREGCTNRQMAERLTVRPKTIEGHLTHLYEKFGVSGRAGLRELLSGAG